MTNQEIVRKEQTTEVVRKVEHAQLKGNFDQIARQLNETYTKENGWAVVRTNSTMIVFSVWLERSVVDEEATKKLAELKETVSDVIGGETPDDVAAKPKTTTKKAPTTKKEV